MLAKLAFKNIKKSFKDYAIYFCTLILGVVIFYIFNSLDSQTAMLRLSESTSSLMRMMEEVLSGVSIFISCVLGFLIIYASRFLIKKRNQEFGIYLTLGMSKRKISTLILLETLIAGVMSLVIGLACGVLISQVTSVFVAKLFEADMEQFAFNFSIAATVKTLIYFGIIYLVVMIFDVVMVGKCKLIELLQAEKKNEKIRLKNPALCIVLFLASVAMMGWSYWAVTDGFYTVISNRPLAFILVPIGLGCVGTYLLFWSISGMALRIISSCKNIYGRKLNSFTFKQLSSKINSMVASISIICVMLFMTICLLSSALSIANYFNNSIQKYASADMEVEVYRESETQKATDFEKIFSENGVLDDMSDLVTVSVYSDPNFNYGDSLGLALEEITAQYPYITFDAPIDIMSSSDYNKLADILQMESAKVGANEYAIVVNYETWIYSRTLELDSKMNIFGTNLSPNGSKIVDGFNIINGGAFNMGFFVVPDGIIKNEVPYKDFAVINYFTQEHDDQVELNEKIAAINYGGSGVSFDSKIRIKENSIGLSAMATFVGLYLGLIFLISSAAILALKVLSDTIDDREKYNILRKIGADEKQIKGSLFKQELIFFLLPLVLALIHTIFGIKFCLMILETIGVTTLLGSMITTCIIIVLIYGGYFIAAYACSKNML